MTEMFFGKFFKQLCVFYLLLFPIAAIVYFTNIGWIFLIVLFIFTFFATLKRIEFGLGIAMIELVSNAHGYLFSTQIGSFVLSGRMVIFLSVMIAWLFLLCTKRIHISQKHWILFVILPIFSSVIIGLINGFVNVNPVSAFKDGNAYLYLVYLLPLLNIQWNPLLKRSIFQILSAGSVLSVWSTFVLFYLYTHFSEPLLRTMYVFLRDIRYVEITNLGNGMYRVFEQTQFFAIIFAFALLPFAFLQIVKKDRMILIGFLSLISSITLLSMSRSFWFGLVLTGIVFVLILLLQKETSFKQWKQGITTLLVSGIGSLILILGVLLFPFPHGQVEGWSFSNVFSSRATDSDVAITSRWNLLPSMMKQISKNPIIGSGFGKTVTFKTDDPRARAIFADGTWTTYSMEWGWHELWLKMGILGPISFMILFGFMFSFTRSLFLTEQSWIGMWCVLSLVFLFTTHIFSPYLNHPIGLGTILFIIIFLPSTDSLSFEFVFNRQKQKVPQTIIAATLQQRIEN